MTWLHSLKGAHVHVRVYISGALAGTLIFRIEEFEAIRRESNKIKLIEFKEEK